MSTKYTGTTILLLKTYDGDMSWQQQAECRRTKADGKTPVYPPKTFFPASTTGPGAVQTEEAKSICRRCPVVEPCARWAIDVQEYGVHGALDEDQRRDIRRARARARATAS